MNIGEVAEASGLPAKTIRYYEDIGLVRPLRSENRARSLGFSIEDCRTLLSLYEDRDRASADVKAVAEEHLARIERKIEELQSLRSTLVHLVSSCHGDRRPDCPILDGLAGDAAAGRAGLKRRGKRF